MSGQRRLAVVIGGAQRVGRAICVELASAGYDLIVTYCRSLDDAKVTQQSCITNGAKTDLYSLDLMDLEAVDIFADQLNQDHPKVDTLIFNAARYVQTPWETVDADELQAHHRVNVISPLLLTRSLTGSLRRACGNVVFMADIHAMGRPRLHYPAYLISKAAVVEMVRVLALELAPEIRVNGVAPGVVAWPNDAIPAEISRYEQKIPLKRAGTPQNAAQTVRFLATDAHYITGEIIRVDGGRSLT